MAGRGARGARGGGGRGGARGGGGGRGGGRGGGAPRSLFEADEEEDGVQLRVNAKFAEKYAQRKLNEELTDLRTRLDDADDDEEDDSEDDEPEDETGELVTPAIDKQVFRTLSLIKARDPSVYDSQRHFFSEQELDAAQKNWEAKKAASAAAPKPMKLKDYERKRLLEEGPEAFGVDEDRVASKPPPTYVEEQEELRAMFRRSKAGGNDEDADEDDLFVPRAKSDKEQEAEEDDFRDFLMAQQKAEDQKKADELDALRRYWTDPNLDPNEAFLRDYLLNRGWMDKDSTRVPSYEQIVGRSSGDTSKIDDNEDAEHVEKTDEFEYAYNFRFEEPNAALVQTYSRNDDESVRRKDSRRKEEREHRRTLKESQKSRKQEELRRLRDLKKMEILKKLREIERVSGAPAIGFEEVDLEAEFDPAEHDRRMEALFNDAYYAEGADDAKPEFPDDPLLDGASGADGEGQDDADADADADAGDGDGDGEAQDAAEESGIRIRVPTIGPDGRKLTRREREKEKKRLKKAAKAAKASVAGDDFVMDADYVAPAVAAAPKPSTGKRAKASDSADPEEVARRLAEVAPEQRGQVGALLDDYYSVNYEDLIGDQPTRFRYRKVEPSTYGLSLEEILLADDRDLNAHISLKKLAPYRLTDMQKADRVRASKAKRVKAFRERLNAKWDIREDGSVAPKVPAEADVASPAAPAPAASAPKARAGAADAVPVARPSAAGKAGRALPPGTVKPWSKAARKAAALGVTPDRLASYMVQKRTKPGDTGSGGASQSTPGRTAGKAKGHKGGKPTGKPAGKPTGKPASKPTGKAAGKPAGTPGQA